MSCIGVFSLSIELQDQIDHMISLCKRTYRVEWRKSTSCVLLARIIFIHAIFMFNNNISNHEFFSCDITKLVICFVIIILVEFYRKAS